MVQHLFIDAVLHALIIPSNRYRRPHCSSLTFAQRQQAGDALVKVEEEGDAVGVGGVGFFATAGLVGGVYGGV